MIVSNYNNEGCLLATRLGGIVIFSPNQRIKSVIHHVKLAEEQHLFAFFDQYVLEHINLEAVDCNGPLPVADDPAPAAPSHMPNITSKTPDIGKQFLTKAE